MAKSTKTRTNSTRANIEINARELWLAGLGAMSLTRKQGIKLYDTLKDEGRNAQTRVTEAVANVTETVNSTIETVRGRVDAIVTPVRERAEATYAVVKDEVETRLQPVLARLGVAPAVKTVSKKKAVRKPVAKRSTRSRKAA